MDMTPAELRKISEEATHINIQGELNEIFKRAKDSAQKGAYGTTVKNISLQAKRLLTSMGYTITSHDDIRQPENDHYIISW